jgi:hypothetical protein
MADTDNRLRCLVLGQQIGDNVADLGQLLDDLVPAPTTTVARDTHTLASAYVARINAEIATAVQGCGLGRGSRLNTLWTKFVDAWGSQIEVAPIRDAWDAFHDELDKNQTEASEL